MKKAFIFLALTVVMFPLFAQKNINWQKIDSPKDDYLFKYFYQYTNDVYKAIFTIPNVKPFQPIKNQIFIRTFNADLSKFDEVGIPSEAPYELSITDFYNYTVIYGSTDENKNPMVQYREPNKLVITDAKLNPLIQETYAVHGKRQKFAGTPSAYKSLDSTHLIVINTIIKSPDKPSLKESPRMNYITVYDKDLKVVWNDSIDYEQIFGAGVPLNSCDVNYVNNKLYIIASHRTIPTKKLKASLYVVRYDSPQSYKVIYKEIMPYDQFALSSVKSKDDKFVISGINQVPNSSSKKQLFFISMDLLNPGNEPVVKKYPIDKVFIARYPEYKSILLPYISYPSDLILVNDGILYCSEYHLEVTRTTNSSSSTTYYNKPLTFIKFDMDGKIEWIKMIEKYTASRTAYYEYFSKAYLSDGKVVVFYYDYLDNIYKDKYKGKFLSFIIDSKLCLAQAIIDGEGNIKKSLIYNIGENGTRANLNRMRQIDNSRFFLCGSGISMKTRGDFATIYDLKE